MSDPTAAYLLKQIKILRRIGDAAHRRDADRWERIIREHAQPEEATVVDFATSTTPEPQSAQD
jgi:hypothetical protein